MARLIPRKQIEEQQDISASFRLEKIYMLVMILLIAAHYLYQKVSFWETIRAL